MNNETNPFLSPDYEAHLEALTHGPMTSNSAGVLIRPVDQLAEAVREYRKRIAAMEAASAAEVADLHAKLAEQEKRIVGLVGALTTAERFLAHRVNGDFFGSLNGIEAEGYTLAQVRAALTTSPSAAVEAVEGMRKALEAQPCRCSLLLKCPHCAGDVVEGVDQFSGSWICGACVETVALPKDPAYPCIRCAALAAWKETTRG